VVVSPAWAYDTESYSGGSVTTRRAYQAGKVEGDDPGSKGYPGLPGCGLEVGLTTPSGKKYYCHKSSKKKEEVKSHPGMYSQWKMKNV
jgi:hypothetical protein